MPTVLVTGASRGIGKAVTERMAGKGWTVYAGVRSDADGAALAAAAGDIRPITLDVTSEADVEALTKTIESLDAVVNNAGYAQDGPVEGLSVADMRRQLDVNVVGQIAVTQQVLPLLRASKGRVVFISSLSGRISTPMTGIYNASKFALEAIADAWRVELRPWDIPVVLVEPGATATDIWATALDKADETYAAMTPEMAELYKGHFVGTRKLLATMQKRAVPVSDVADTVERALTARRPKVRYPVGIEGHAQLAARAVTPTRVWDAVLARVSGAR